MIVSHQLGRPAPQAAPLRNLCVLRVSALDSSSIGLTLNFQLSTFNRVFFSPSSPHLCALCVLRGENSLSFRSSLIPRHSPLTANSFTIRTSTTPLPQLLYNPHLRAPLGSAGNKGLITPLESALTKNSPVTPVESALTKTGGVGSFRGFILDHPSSRVPEIRPGQCKGSVFEVWEGFQNFGGSGALEHRIILANSPVAEDQHALRELRNVVFVRDQHDGQSFVVLSAPERYASSSPIATPTCCDAVGLCADKGREMAR